MSKLFLGKVVLVTGASSGIGRATAVAFAREGAKVVVAARRVAESEATVRLIEAAGGSGYYVQTDVSKSVQVQNLVARTIEHYGALDVAVNNAGQDPDAFMPVHKYDEARWPRLAPRSSPATFCRWMVPLSCPRPIAESDATLPLQWITGIAFPPGLSPPLASKRLLS
jgi:NAD(P)-dependent dehydrogenase (short-subunit alcohol dehydrogenase family)